MAWSWSHTNEAYAAARENLGALDRDTLETILAEWRCYSPGHDGADEEGFRAELWDGCLADVRAARYAVNTLADAIWDSASELATCDNGGFNAWVCPYGCGPHTVSFDSPKEGQ